MFYIIWKQIILAILLSDDAADKVLAKKESLVFTHFLTPQSNMSSNKGISGEQLQHDWLLHLTITKKMSNSQHPLSPYLIGLITTGSSVLHLLRKAVYLVQTLCICQAMWLFWSLTLWQTGSPHPVQTPALLQLGHLCSARHALKGPFFGHECTGGWQPRHFKKKVYLREKTLKSCKIWIFFKSLSLWSRSHQKWSWILKQ